VVFFQFLLFSVCFTFSKVPINSLKWHKLLQKGLLQSTRWHGSGQFGGLKYDLLPDVREIRRAQQQQQQSHERARATILSLAQNVKRARGKTPPSAVCFKLIISYNILLER